VSRENVNRSMFPEGDPGRSSFRKANQAYALALLGVVFWGVSASAWSSSDVATQVMFFLGVLMVAIGLVFRIWVSTYQAGYKNKRLITVGPYSLCRNPMYLSNLLGGIGASLTTGTLLIPVAFAIVFLIHYRRVIPDEEARLRRHHGEAFDAYRAATPLLMPSFKLFSQPDEYVVRTRDLLARIPLALWPMGAVAAIYLGAVLHAHGLLPLLLRIY
jgi:protein-S-isoprenylcysteine O-methyltransferase Ste14